MLSSMVNLAFAQAPQRAPLSYRATYANDQFNHTDRYYTAGLHQSIGTDQFRVGLTQALYSPTDIRDSEMRTGDRPYAATSTVSVQRYLLGQDTSDHWIVEGSLGMIGPHVGGERIQRFVHGMVGVAAPAGWRYQIANDLLLGLQINYVRQLLRRRLLEADAGAELRLGTPFTRVGLDSRVAFGPRGLKLQVAASTYRSLYDATIQGGGRKQESPLRYDHGSLSPIVGRLEIGVVARRGRWSGFCSQVLLSPELRAGTGHAYVVCGGEIQW